VTSNPYQVLGPSVPRMLGREALLRRIDGQLSKMSPDHISVVGPAHYGKSVLLRHVADAYREDSGHYLTTVHVDLRHAGIMSDGDFRRCFAEDLRAALRPHRPDVAKDLAPEEDSIHELLDLVFDELAAERARVLVVFDGFDHVLARADLTRTLWDQLRTLAQKPSLRFVAGSRLPLREVCRTEESRTSDFWEIFNPTPIRVGALDGDDLRAFMQPLLATGCTIDQSARKEIADWTGGVPLLVSALLRRLWDGFAPSTGISQQDIDRAAEALLDEEPDLFGALWDDCDFDLRADLATLADANTPRADLSNRRLRNVEDRGFGSVTGKRLRSTCRLMQRYARTQAPAIADLKRLLGSAAGFETHIRSVLEMRLQQVAAPGTDRHLLDFVTRAVSDLHGRIAPGAEPQSASTAGCELAINSVRGIATRALALIWEAELPPDRTPPSDWIDEWKHAGERFRDDRGKLPRGYGPQCSILRLATGTDRVQRKSRYVTKTTYLLIDHLQSVGDFGQHRSDFPEAHVTVGFAASIVLTAIALVESLTTDLQREQDATPSDRATPSRRR